MVDTQPRAEYALQAFCDLRSKGYFGEKVQHLLSLPDGFFYQVNIDFRLAACRDTMQQTDILALEILQNGMICLLLMLIQWIDGNNILQECCVQTADFLLVDFKHTTLHKAVEGTGSSGSTLQQFGFGDFLHIPSTEAAGEFHVFHQQVQLLGGTALQFVEEDVQAVFVARGYGQAHTGFGLGLIGAAQFFLYEDSFFIEQ